MLTIYGIKNCDTMKKAFLWLNEQNIAFYFHDYKKDGLADSLLTEWLYAIGWEALINQNGTTWRKLALDKNTLNNDTAFSLIKNNLSLIKRPIIISNDIMLISFKPDMWQVKLQHLKSQKPDRN